MTNPWASFKLKSCLNNIHYPAGSPTITATAFIKNQLAEEGVIAPSVDRAREKTLELFKKTQEIKVHTRLTEQKNRRMISAVSFIALSVLKPLNSPINTKRYNLSSFTLKPLRTPLNGLGAQYTITPHYKHRYKPVRWRSTHMLRISWRGMPFSAFYCFMHNTCIIQAITPINAPTHSEPPACNMPNKPGADLF